MLYPMRRAGEPRAGRRSQSAVRGRADRHGGELPGFGGPAGGDAQPRQPGDAGGRDAGCGVGVGAHGGVHRCGGFRRNLRAAAAGVVGGSSG